MIGTQRSGSNLLRVMLNQLPELIAPHPPHIINVFAPLVKFYGDLDNQENFKILVNDVCPLIERNPVQWNLNFDRKEIASACKKRSLISLFIVLHNYKASQNAKATWCCKSLEAVNHLHLFTEAGFNPFIIYLYRDGRDVACSFKRVLIGEKHIYHLAVKWAEEQERALSYVQRLSEEEYTMFNYRKLLDNPREVVKEICDKTGLRYSDAILDYYKSEEAQNTSLAGSMWNNLVKPVIKNNTNKFPKELSSEEIEIFERVAGRTLIKLGYELVTKPVSTSFSTQEIAFFDSENVRLKKLAYENAAPEDIEHRKAYDDYISELKQRLKEAPLK